MKADGTGLKVLAPGNEPAWSPDGRRIAFTRTRCTADICGADLYVMAADGSGVQRLTNVSPFDGASAPAWSPDGTRIAYVRRCCFLLGEGSGLATIGPEGGLSHLLHAGTIIGRPVWAPDGSAIVFAEGSGAGIDAMIMPAAGGTAEVLVGGRADDRPTSWK
jgi:Tol biopolymer transport system component